MADRIPYVELDAVSEHIREILTKHPHTIALWRIMAHAQDGFEPWMRFNGSLMSRNDPPPTGIEHQLREMAVIQTCLLCDSPYEWTAHARNAVRLFKIPIEQVDAVTLERDIDALALTDDQRLVLRFTTEIVQNVRASETTMTAMLDRFTHRQIVELTFVIGAYLMNCRLAELGRLHPLSDGELNSLFERNPYLEHMQTLGHRGQHPPGD